MLIHTALMADPDALGKVDYAAHPQETLMELLVDGVSCRYLQEDHGAFREADGTFLDISRWKGVTRDSNGSIIRILWTQPYILWDNVKHGKVSGTLALQWLPQSIQSFEIYDQPGGDFEAVYLPRSALFVTMHRCMLCGTVNAAQLPQRLEVFNISRNMLGGSIKFDDLPATLRHFNISHNKISGTIDLHKLPPNIRVAELHENHLEGSIDLSHVPKSLRTLTLHENAFVGEVDIVMEAVSNHMGIEQTGPRVSLYGNQLRGTVCYFPMPDARADAQVFLANNAFSAIDWPSMDTVKSLNVSKNALQGELDLCKIPQSVVSIDLSANALEGSLHFADLHKGVERLILSSNNFSGVVDFHAMPMPMSKVHCGVLDLSNNSLTGTIRFGQYIPAETFLNANEFTAMKTDPKQLWRNVVTFEAKNNAIAESVVRFSPFSSKKFGHIDLRGNPIGRIETSDASDRYTKKIFFDNGNKVQRRGPKQKR